MWVRLEAVDDQGPLVRRHSAIDLQDVDAGVAQPPLEVSESAPEVAEDDDLGRWALGDRLAQRPLEELELGVRSPDVIRGCDQALEDGLRVLVAELRRRLRHDIV